MASYREDYLILSEVLRKIDMDENYKPTDREQKIVALLLEYEAFKFRVVTIILSSGWIRILRY